MLFEWRQFPQAKSLASVMKMSLIDVIASSTFRVGDTVATQLQEKTTELPAHLPNKRYPLTMQIVDYVKHLEYSFPLANGVTSSETHLISSITCLQRCGDNWPSVELLNFALNHTLDFPCLNRWVE